jgi:hypothetical protein
VIDADSFETFVKHDNLWYPMETGVDFSGASELKESPTPVKKI